MKQHRNTMAVGVVLTLWMVASDLSGAFAQQSISSSLGLIPYPSNGQSLSQQKQDEGEC